MYGGPMKKLDVKITNCKFNDCDCRRVCGSKCYERKKRCPECKYSGKRACTVVETGN
jgi:hypothetical protein